MYLPGTKVRIRTVEELEYDRRRIEGKSYLRYWENTVCEVVIGKRIQGHDKYVLKATNGVPAERGRSDYGLQDLWWYDYELETYDPFKSNDVDESVFITLIEG